MNLSTFFIPLKLRNYRIPLCILLLNILFINPRGISAQTTLTSTEINEDLDQFQTELEERFAYLKANQNDYISAINTIRERGENGMNIDEFGLAIRRVLGLFIDCHGSINGFNYPIGYLPFKIEPAEGRYVAFWPDRGGFVDNDYPFIRKIDGRTIEQWCEIVEVYSPKGSPQFIRYVCLWYISQIKFARREAGDEDKDTFTVELESRSGGTKTAEMNVIYDASSLNSHRHWPENSSSITKWQYRLSSSN